MTSSRQWTSSQIAGALFFIALCKSAFIALVISPSYGPDGTGYLAYIDAFRDPTIPETQWYIRGTTPIYPWFAYSAYLLGLGSGYMISIIQILLGATLAPLLYLALKRVEPTAAALTGLFVAIDPQIGHAFQLVSTEGLYIIGLGSGLAFFVRDIFDTKPRLVAAFLLGLLLGLGAFVRPVGMFLIVPYAFFHLLIARSPKRTLTMSLGYLFVIMILVVVNVWRFDNVATHNTSGLYLGTRLFSVGGLYDRDNGAESERLYQLAQECGITLNDIADESQLQVSQDLRLCLVFERGMSLEELGSLYQASYAEAVGQRPFSFVETMTQQLLSYVTTPSIMYDRKGAEQLLLSCDTTSSGSDHWFHQRQMFCPYLPSPLEFLRSPVFTAILLFSGLTTILNIGIGVLAFRTADAKTRWLLLLCFALYSYHAVVTAVAGVVLSRYVTVTNIYMVTILAFSIIQLSKHHQILGTSQPATLKSNKDIKTGDH